MQESIDRDRHSKHADIDRDVAVDPTTIDTRSAFLAAEESEWLESPVDRRESVESESTHL